MFWEKLDSGLLRQSDLLLSTLKIDFSTCVINHDTTFNNFVFRRALIYFISGPRLGQIRREMQPTPPLVALSSHYTAQRKLIRSYVSSLINKLGFQRVPKLCKHFHSDMIHFGNQFINIIYREWSTQTYSFILTLIELERFRMYIVSFVS